MHTIYYICGMHELSIAISIIELAEEEARKANASSISRVEVEIGAMAGVETEALLFAWDAAIRGTLASQASLIIHPIEGEAICSDCGKVFPVEHLFTQCPACDGFRYKVVKGKELKVSSLMVE